MGTQGRRRLSRAGRGATVSLTLIQRSAGKTVQIDRRLQFAPKKSSVSCRFASSQFDKIAVTAKHQPRRMDMHFISICTFNAVFTFLADAGGNLTVIPEPIQGP